MHLANEPLTHALPSCRKLRRGPRAQHPIPRSEPEPRLVNTANRSAMNRIYQGRVSSVQIPKPGVKNEWDPLPNWQDALWQHHELFQDAVNYYTLALAALAEGLTSETAQGTAALAWRTQVRENWLDGRRRALRYDGPHKRLAPWLGVDANMTNEHAAFDASAQAILRVNGSTTTQRAAALLQLLEEADASSDLNQVCVNRLRWFCTRKGASSATPSNVVAQQEIERIRQAQAIHAATIETLAAVARSLEPGRFVTQMPAEYTTGEEARKEALKQFKAAANKASGLDTHEAVFKAHIIQLGDALRVPQLGRKPSGLYPLALVLHLWPERAAWEAFKQVTKNLVGKDAPTVTADAIADARTGDEPLFDYYTNRALIREPANTTHAVWFEFDLAAFLEAIKAPHRFYQDKQTRDIDARKRREQLHAIEPDAGWLKDVPLSAAKKKPAKKSAAVDADDDTTPSFTFAGDYRIAILRSLLIDADKLGCLGEVAEGEPVEYTIQERTLRGWPKIREVWRKRAARGAFTPGELWADVAEIQGKHHDDFGSATLYEALTKPENHPIWLDAPPQSGQHADDPLQAWKEYKELCFELKDKERAIRFTPAHAEKSPRYFILPKAGRFGTEHVRAQPTESKLHFTTGITSRTANGLEPIKVRFEYSAPRLRRDELRAPGEADLASSRWLQPMMQALGIPEPDVQDFANCRVTFQPSSRDNHQLTFPVPVEVAKIHAKLGHHERWDYQTSGAKGEKNFAQFNYSAGEPKAEASLRWPSDFAFAKEAGVPRKREPRPWHEKLNSFTTLAIDLGQRDAGAYALLDVRANDDFNARPSRPIGETGEGAANKKWRAALAASGLLRLSGEDRIEWRKASKAEQARGEQDFAWREELFGEHGRNATAEETDECAGLLLSLGVKEAEFMPAGWRQALSFPEQNTKLLVAARRAQSRMARLHRWAWFLADEGLTERIKNARLEIADVRKDAIGQPEPAQTRLAALASGEVSALRTAVRDDLLQAQRTLPGLLVQIANRVLPLRGRSWRWQPNVQAPGCHFLDQTGPDRGDVWLRGQRGLSLERIEQIEELRKRFLSLNQSLRREIGGQAPTRRDDAVPDPCPDLLEKLDRLKTQRVNQTAHLILAQALGVRLRAPGSDKAQLRAERDQHGQYEKFRTPADFIVIEDLARYRASQGRAPRENSRLMKWCHRAIRAKLRELCEPFGIPVVETVAAWSSRFCARSGVPGFRAKEITAGFTQQGQWAWLAGKKDQHGKPTEEALYLHDLDEKLTKAQQTLEHTWAESKRPGPYPKRTLLVPVAGGPVFIPLCDQIPDPDHPKLQPAVVQSDINAAINLALRAVADPRLWSIHPRLRTQREGKDSLFAKEKRKYGARKAPAITPVGETKLPEDTGRVPNFFFDRSRQIGWGHAEVSDPLGSQSVRVVLGVAMWKTVREAQWERCTSINARRLADWRRKLAPADDIPM
ncbi:MAG: type V CRISPR-associated protein Cas12b [Candidatus Didemnitutus sp.]|nr:type V CRISPR-associated protein Cas12b [Candidatus Didemnitutus sp.]